MNTVRKNHETEQQHTIVTYRHQECRYVYCVHSQFDLLCIANAEFEILRQCPQIYSLSKMSRFPLRQFSMPPK